MYLSICRALLTVNAVEKVTVLARLLSVDSIQNNHQIKTSLAHAACCLIDSLQDINLYVVERTALYLETIKASSIKVHCFAEEIYVIIHHVWNDGFWLKFSMLTMCMYCSV